MKMSIRIILVLSTLIITSLTKAEGLSQFIGKRVTLAKSVKLDSFIAYERSGSEGFWSSSFKYIHQGEIVENKPAGDYCHFSVIANGNRSQGPIVVQPGEVSRVIEQGQIGYLVEPPSQLGQFRIPGHSTVSFVGGSDGTDLYLSGFKCSKGGDQWSRENLLDIISPEYLQELLSSVLIFE